MGSLLNEAGKMEKKDMVKTETFNSLLILFLIPKIFFQESQTFGIREKKSGKKEDLPSVEEDDQFISWIHTSAGYSLS